MPKITLSKLEVAQRQLETAITLFFHDNDPVSVHTLANASYDILHDICKLNGKAAIPVVKNADFIKPDKRKMWLDTINRARNYFKHADRDADKTLEFNPDENDMLLYDACRIYTSLTNQKSPLMLLLQAWFFVKYPRLIKIDDEKSLMFYNNVKKITLDPNSKAQFYKMLPFLEEECGVPPKPGVIRIPGRKRFFPDRWPA